MWTLKRVMQLGIRYLVSIVLLFFVWKNSHWAVALALTLTMASVELATINRLSILFELRRLILNELKKPDDQEHKESSNGN